jgi:hypothetical protein
MPEFWSVFKFDFRLYLPVYIKSHRGELSNTRYDRVCVRVFKEMRRSKSNVYYYIRPQELLKTVVDTNKL